MVKLSRTGRGLGAAVFFLAAFAGLADGDFVVTVEAASTLMRTLDCGAGLA
jgi:hypothetical protein